MEETKVAEVGHEIQTAYDNGVMKYSLGVVVNFTGPRLS